MRFGSLFSGIGGLDLGLERAGMSCSWQVEIDDYANRVLAKHWPDIARFNDVRRVGRYNLEAVDVIAGGFPCQDVSVAGTGKGLEGDRSGLWREYLRIICDLRPRFIVVENVAALLARGAGRVLADLASIGYDAEWQTVQASDVGAPHTRARLFIVAYTNSFNGEAGLGPVANRQAQIFTGGNRQRFPIWLQTTDQFVGVDDGLSAELYRGRGKAIGNAVVPQVAEFIGRSIMRYARGQ